MRTRIPHQVLQPLARARRWPVEAQQRACRNAMVASTALARTRAEREDVEEFLAARARAAEAGPGARHA